MKKQEKILTNVLNDKELIKYISANKYYTPENFIKDANQYIEAIQEDRMLCNIPSVSSSGMSRVIKFSSCEKNSIRKTYWYSNYYAFFLAMGYKEDKNHDGFRIHGCGMDMVFHTNYSIIHKLHNLGFFNRKRCDVLAQKTPVKI